MKRNYHMDGLVQDYSNSSALAMELLECTKPPGLSHRHVPIRSGDYA